jgi:hypothetical protein
VDYFIVSFENLEGHKWIFINYNEVRGIQEGWEWVCIQGNEWGIYEGN